MQDAITETYYAYGSIEFFLEQNPLAKHLLEKILKQGMEIKEEFRVKEPCEGCPNVECLCMDTECCIQWCMSDCGWSLQWLCIATCGVPDNA